MYKEKLSTFFADAKGFILEPDCFIHLTIRLCPAAPRGLRSAHLVKHSILKKGSDFVSAEVDCFATVECSGRVPLSELFREIQWSAVCSIFVFRAFFLHHKI